MTRSAALIVINYKTAGLAADAIRTARAAYSAPLQVIVVDNSVDAREAEALRPIADVVIIAERNLGYAAAINRARQKTDAEALIVANPDVVFGAHSLDALLGVDAAVAGPALYWDDAYEWMLPQAELQTAAQVLDRALASRSRTWARKRDRRRIAARLAFWSRSDLREVQALSGSVLAIRTSAFDRAGGFDERFPLYFEENDFLRRVERPILYVPAARCRHIYNQSAGDSPEAAALYAISERVYLEKWNGRYVARVLKTIERPVTSTRATELGDEPIVARPGTVVEASPLSTFDMAAGHFPRSSAVTIPPSIWDNYRGNALYLRVIDRGTGSILANYVRTKIRI